MPTRLRGSNRWCAVGSRVRHLGSRASSIVLPIVFALTAASGDPRGQAPALRNGTSPPTPQGQVRKEPNLGGEVDRSSQDPDVALSRLKVADGYEVNLFASEREFRELAKPVAMTFDTRGRLWVLTAPTYPHYLPGRPPQDKLIILEDTNRDGRADKSTVFADGLYIPTGFELGDGGAYVSQQPNLVFLRDTNGDDRADERRIVLHGFGT